MKKKNARARWSAERLTGSDVAILQGEARVTVYGCRRILRYEPTRVCVKRAHGRVCVRGEALICTAFSMGCVTVEGRIDSVGVCREECDACRVGDGRGTT